MQIATISEITAREILDSKGRPMLEVDVLASDGSTGRGSSPCGTSVGRHEAVILRDGDRRFGGLGVRKAMKNVSEIIFPALRGKNILQQQKLDTIMIELDATTDKSRLGANSIYSVSIAAARAAANSLGLPLYQYLAETEKYILPIPVFNMINGGTYGDRKVEIQEFLLVPTAAETFSEALRMSVEVFGKLEGIIAKRYGRGSLQLGCGAGYAAPVNEPAECLETLLDAVEAAGYTDKFRVGLDCAASQFYDRESRYYMFRGKKTSRDEMIEFLVELADSYPVCMIEDPLDEDDFEGHASILERLDILISGDDLLVTNIERVKKSVAMKAANAIVIKPNMVGTITEALETAAYAKENGYCLVPGGRGGGSVDDPIPDIAVALGAPMVKFGAPRAGEKVNKYNRLFQITDEIGKAARFSRFEDIEAKRKGI
ncbi:MAG: phosphopyruvate hydratase [Gemmatimonadota bacterium]|nr:phosphopyruvate hydratase [Gemmatimonadota bacterium]